MYKKNRIVKIETNSDVRKDQARDDRKFMHGLHLSWW